MRDLFNTHIYVSGEESDHLSTLLRAFPVVIEADQIQKALRKEQREPTSAEAQTLALATELRDQIVQVDVFEKHGVLEQQAGYVRPAIAATESWEGAVENESFK